MADPQTFIDYEFHMDTGDVIAISQQDGRDTVEYAEDGSRTTFNVLTDKDLTDTWVIVNAKIAWVKRTTRTVKPEPQVERR